MGLFQRLFGGGGPRRVESQDVDDSARREEEVMRFGDIRVDVVGESNYQAAIRKACDWKPGTDTRFECMAELVPEPTNRYDPNAIMVQISGACVGYLSRGDALKFGPAIRSAIEQQGVGCCRAVIAGRSDGETDNLGVFLRLDAELV
ncbi:MAG TPA: HIRAN domain-containing protein [Solirubrobacterales bacterium]|nr:HIRAN domain-containing protein [Solirubrobacterales bacterium]